MLIIPGIPPAIPDYSAQQTNLPVEHEFDELFDQSINDPFAIPDNPFAPPVAPQLSPAAFAKRPAAKYQSRAGQSRTNPLMVPAIFLISFSSLSLLLLFLSLISNVILFAVGQETMQNDPMLQQDAAFNTGRLMGQVCSALLQLISNGYILAGAISMCRLRGYTQARRASIIGMIPCCTGCFILGIPFAIWSFVLLGKPEIARSFRD